MMNRKNDELPSLESLVEDLVDVSKKLAEGSKHDISLSELKVLQEEQSAILKNIEKLQKDIPIDDQKAFMQRIKEKLHQFVENNSIYINNVKRIKGMIHLEGKPQD